MGIKERHLLNIPYKNLSTSGKYTTGDQEYNRINDILNVIAERPSATRDEIFKEVSDLSQRNHPH